MAKLTKKAKLIAEKVEAGKSYPIEEAVALLAQLATSRFKESIDVSINLGVDPRKSDQAVRGATTLPHGTGKVVRVAVFAQGENAEKARAAGADLVGFEDLAESIKGGVMDFDVVIASPDAMRIVGQLGTITPDVEGAVRNAKSGQVRYRTDKNGIIHGGIGKADFEASAVKGNLEALLVDLKKAKPASAKGNYVKKIVLSSTMGPGIQIDQSSLDF